MSATDSTADANPPANQRFLCLHGFRTSGRIMFMQTGVMRYHVKNCDFVFLDAPFPAMGMPDSGVATVYANEKYYEWIQMLGNGVSEEDRHQAKGKSVDYIVDFIKKNGPFDGIMGFSQGAAMAAGLAIMQERRDPLFQGQQLFSKLILIGGVSPVSFLSSIPQSNQQTDSDIVAERLRNVKISMPTLHIMGTADPLYNRALDLLSICTESTRTVLEHSEGHNIPSVRTGLYPSIVEWIDKQQQSKEQSIEHSKSPSTSSPQR